MYKIIKDGKLIGQTEAVTYIILQDNGCYGLSDEKNAHGVVYGGTPYHLLGRPDMDGTETVMVEETDAGSQLSDIQGTIDDLVIASLEFPAPEEGEVQNV